MRARRYSVLFIVAAVIVAADQLTKLVVQASMPPLGRVTVVKGFFDLIYVRNSGGAFGLLSRSDPAVSLPFFVIVTAGVAALIIYYYRRIPPGQRLYRIALAFILGGAAGNLVDRVRIGQVIDFLDFHLGRYHWPAFNAADACISAGAVMFLISLLRTERE